jgi:hypothetical protein
MCEIGIGGHREQSVLCFRFVAVLSKVDYLRQFSFSTSRRHRPDEIASQTALTSERSPKVASFAAIPRRPWGIVVIVRAREHNHAYSYLASSTTAKVFRVHDLYGGITEYSAASKPLLC